MIERICRPLRFRRPRKAAGWSAILFTVIGHESTHGHFRVILIAVGPQALGLQINLCLDLDRSDPFPIVDQKVHFARAPVIGIMVYLQAIDRLELLQHILLGQSNRSRRSAPPLRGIRTRASPTRAAFSQRPAGAGGPAARRRTFCLVS